MTNLFAVAGKVALVTGGSRGIGLMIARAYVENGVKVYISARKVAACEQTAVELSQNGTCIAIPADLATAAGRAALVNEIQARETQLDILVNNAGASWGAPLDDFPEAGYDKTMDINVKALFLLTRDLLPLLRASGTAENPARVINIGSIDGLRVPAVANFPYAASKAAVHHLTRVLAVELGPQHVTVNAIAPGPFESKMTEWLLENFQDDIEAACPLGRIGSPEDMAGAALYLASRAGAYVNGTVIPIDGGIWLRGPR
ncbi:MAG: SDR family oxidoreductase [Ardenticatenaceae bacterium]|nr:SDR family oxidoreductase [Ardenticatenaceae bacterium]